MLSFITIAWLITMPTLLTAFILQRFLKQALEEAAARSRVPATIARNK